MDEAIERYISHHDASREAFDELCSTLKAIEVRFILMVVT